MSKRKSAESNSPLQNPQVVAAIIGGIVTVVAAIVGIVPAIITSQKATPIVITFTPVPATTVAVVLPTAIPATDTPVPATPLPAEPTQQVQLTAINAAQPTAVLASNSNAVPPSPIFPSPTNTIPSVLPSEPPNVSLLYDGVSFTLLNQSGHTLSLEGVFFRSSNGSSWEARRWGVSLYSKLPNGKCLRLRDATVGQRNPPAPCVNNIYGLQEVGTTALFWLGATSFEVIRNDQVIATCQIADQQCGIYIP